MKRKRSNKFEHCKQCRNKKLQDKLGVEWFNCQYIIRKGERKGQECGQRSKHELCSIHKYCQEQQLKKQLVKVPDNERFERDYIDIEVVAKDFQE